MNINEFRKKNSDEIIKNIKENNNNSFINIYDEKFKNKKVIGIKDIHLNKNKNLTVGSKILENFISEIDSDVVKQLKLKDYQIVGSLNMDEFAMGFSNKTSHFGGVDNAINSKHIAGGSSGGSAYAVARGLIPVATGTDTGGSIRQPAAFNGIYGMKPTYGLIPRYGTVAFASSFDTIGILSNTIEDNMTVLQDLAHTSERDQTSFCPDDFEVDSLINQKIEGTKIAILKTWMEDIEGKEIEKVLKKKLNILEKAGAIIEVIDIPTVKYSFELYSVLAYAEGSSNLSRYDGIKYGLKNNSSEFSEYRRNFGKEVRKRLIIGAYMSSFEHSNVFFKKAQQIRVKMINQFKDVFEKYDLIIGPTTMGTALKKDEDLSSKKGYLYDYFLIVANLIGVPAMNIPAGFDDKELPIGMQLIADKYNEKKIYQIAKFLEGEKNE